MTRSVVLLGRGIAYSASPPMHNAAFATLGLDWSYGLRDVDVNGLAEVTGELRSGILAGANVTQPHKAAIIPLLDDLTAAARRVDAVNTIVRSDDGRLVGDNTDLPALAAELDLLGHFHRAVVLGRGGAARTAVAVLRDGGASTVAVSRDRWSELPSLLAGADVLVNATPVGTGTDETPVDVALLRRDLAVMDLVYRPSPTRLVREAMAAGARAVSGAGMLLRQAAVSFALWTGLEPPVDAMRDALGAELRVVTNA